MDSERNDGNKIYCNNAGCQSQTKKFPHHKNLAEELDMK
jgi:hypothetical protein